MRTRMLARKCAVATMCAIVSTAFLSLSTVAGGDALPTDQLTINGSCLSANELQDLAVQAINAYVPGGPPAGVYVNSTWQPAAWLFVAAQTFATCVYSSAGGNGAISTSPTTTTGG